jgi:DNA-directed RNA polymerase specialized sigma subunit
MSENGSPPPLFSTDEARTYFLAEFPVHPEMAGVQQAHDEVHEKAHERIFVDLNETERAILQLLATGAKSRLEIAEFLGVNTRRSGHLLRAMNGSVN